MIDKLAIHDAIHKTEDIQTKTGSAFTLELVHLYQ